MLFRINTGALGEFGEIVRTALRKLDEAIMPRCCVFCGTYCHPDEAYLCVGCVAALPWIIESCARCAQPTDTALPDGVYCADCQQHPPPFGGAVAALHYTFPVDAAIKALKFHRRLDYVPAFGAILTQSLKMLRRDIDALLPVPLHWRRHASRGFNQASELCKTISKSSGIPMLRNVTRVHKTPYQSGLDAADRRRNLSAAFAVRGGIHARHVLIVDDVITTGATASELARTVLSAGAEQVSVIAIARVSN